MGLLPKHLLLKRMFGQQPHLYVMQPNTKQPASCRKNAGSGFYGCSLLWCRENPGFLVVIPGSLEFKRSNDSINGRDDN